MFQVRQAQCPAVLVRLVSLQRSPISSLVLGLPVSLPSELSEQSQESNFNFIQLRINIQGSSGENTDNRGRGAPALHEAAPVQGALVHGGQGGCGGAEVSKYKPGAKVLTPCSDSNSGMEEREVCTLSPSHFICPWTNSAIVKK